jgi:hypothetical protein
MFMNTMAVGPFELVASCVTGCTAVARDLDCRWKDVEFHRVGAVNELTTGTTTACDAVLDSWDVDCRSAIATEYRTEKL